MQHLEGRGTPVLYIGRTVLKGQHGHDTVHCRALVPLLTEAGASAMLLLVVEKC